MLPWSNNLFYKVKKNLMGNVYDGKGDRFWGVKLWENLSNVKLKKSKIEPFGNDTRLRNARAEKLRGNGKLLLDT